jgi:hypothetical protein
MKWLFGVKWHEMCLLVIFNINQEKLYIPFVTQIY